MKKFKYAFFVIAILAIANVFVASEKFELANAASCECCYTDWNNTCLICSGIVELFSYNCGTVGGE